MDKDKIEDRKRPSGASDDGAPPRKKVAINGGVAKDEHDNQPEEVWVENYTRGAIYRRMHEYKREAATYSARLEELHKRSLYHDDHLRIVDAWWRQLLQEMELIATSTISPDDASPNPPYLTGVTFQDSIDFQKHLDEKAKSVKSKAEAFIQRLASSRTNIEANLSELQSRIASLLAAQKDYHVRLERLGSEKDQLSEQLNTATLRYFKAEKKLDRVKSAQVQKLERQALANDTKLGTPDADSKEPAEPQGDSVELMQKYKEEHAVVTRQQDQIKSILEEIKGLQEENSSLKSRREALTDDDFIKTDVFKQFKTKCEDLIKQVNHLEATNTQLKDEIEKLTSQRTTFKRQLEAEAQALTQELDSDLVARDHDLARLRSARDELLAENTTRKASQEQHHSALEHMKELVGAKDERITALESEVSRLRPADNQEMTEPDEEVAKLGLDELIARHRKLQQDYQAVMTELPAMEKAYRKAMALSHKKVMDFEALEARNGILTAEKNKADQKYFAARKDADTRNSEIRALRMQNAKSAEVVAQLKDVEAQNRVLLSNLEKQLSDLRQSNATLAGENKKLEASAAEANRRLDGVKKEASDLADLIKTKDSAVATMRERNLALETESERQKVRMETLQKDRDGWKTKAESNSSDVEKGLRSLIVCSICNENFKNTALKTCGHLFCNVCVENRISNRMRKCPNCSRAFDRMDVMPVHH
ncbi:probable E3 ubiquitin-protein ligase BRE1 [Cephalotrichum gorgonifer]|uniref:E3 ubiquitin protein ligase n=1 Tax=Cephalotrichum gorgonifer TaxID=2041049 RepID=A0AAE8N330_9PEZI|nr:probable E3 ubiquitin-protein ligase BRE1 [Cephalotrichum gorgonifer]